MKRSFAKWLPPLPLVFPAVVSGGLLTLCFPPVSLWPLCFVALVPLFAALLRHRPSSGESFKTLFLFGVVFYTTLLWWVVTLIPSAGATIPWVLTPATMILAFYLSIYSSLGFVLISAVTRYRFFAFVAAAPAVWVLADMVRARGELAFPWGAMGYALSDSPAMVQLASVVGLPGLTFVIVLVNVLLGGVFYYRDARAKIVVFVVALMIAGGMWWHGRSVLENLEPPTGEPVRTAVVQPNVDLEVKWKPEFKDSTLKLIEHLTRKSAAMGAELVVFPETCAPTYIEGRDQRFLQMLTALASELDVSIYIGFLDHRYVTPGGGELDIFNSSGLFAPDGRFDKYAKNHLLPFGEQIPLSWKYRWLRKINFGQSNFTPGPARDPLKAAGTSFTPLICFESVLSNLCRDGVKNGAGLLVNITNDGWFGDTPGPVQHAQMCVLRAVEYQRYLVRSANTGISMVVDPAGRVVMSLGLFEPGILIYEIVPSDYRTFYSRFGDWPMFWLSVLLTIAAIFLARIIHK